MSSARPPPPASNVGRGRSRNAAAAANSQQLPPGFGRGRGRGNGGDAAPVGPPPPPGRANSRNPPPPTQLLTKEELDALPPVDWDSLRAKMAKEQDPSALSCTPAEQQIYVQLLSLGMDSKGAEFEKRFEKTLFDLWESAKEEGPFHSALAIAFRCPDFREGKVKTMTGRILNLFERWLSMEDRAFRLSHFLTAPFKRSVFDAFLKQDNVILRAKAFTLCRLQESAKDFMDDIAKLTKACDFKRACEVAAALQLHDRYSLEVFVIPLIVEDKADVADDFLSGSRDHQLGVIKFLDNLIVDNSKKVSDLWKKHPGKHAKCLRLAPKPLGKFIEKWMDRFAVGTEYAPNHCRNRKHGAFIYLMGQKDESSMRRENWRDLVMQYVKDDEELRAKLLDYLVSDRANYDVDEAIFWAKKLEIHEDKLPYAVIQEMGLLDEKMQQQQQEEENWDDVGSVAAVVPTAVAANSGGGGDDWGPLSDGMASASLTEENETKYYQLPLNASQIFFVDTRETFLQFLEQIQSENLTGLDAEYRPKSLTPTQESVAILQVACREKVYLIDVVTLTDILSESEWSRFVNEYFVNKNIVIIGFGLRGDFQVMAKSLDVFADLENKSEGVLDLEMLEKQLTGATSGELVKKPFETTRKGLAGLVESVLGFPLDKRDQMSDWDKRPLSHNQVTYAALDAYVLIDVYTALKDLSEEVKAEKVFHAVAEELMRNKNKIVKVKRHVTPQERAKQRRLAQEELERTIRLPPEEFKPYYAEPISPKELRVVCDSMLQGLCKQLRMRGVDAIAIESFEDFENCGVVAKRDDRMVLTKGGPHYIKLRQMVPKGRCLHMMLDKPEEQIEEVFRYFNVEMKPEDYFSRCMICNNSAYIIISRDSMRKIKEKRVAATGGTGHKKENVRYVPDDYDDDDDFDDYDDGGGNYDGYDAGDYDYEMGPTVASSVWIKLDGGDVNCLTATTRDGVELKVGDVPEGVVDRQDEFHACSKCGKVYWHGSHHDRLLKECGPQE